MKKQYIKVPIPEAISEDGGASILFVNKQTVPLDGAITEALAGNYCTGQKTLIRNFFFGLMQSMADGVRRDGHARQIANFLTVYPVFKGEIDLDKGYDPAKNGVMIRARLLNEMDLDITDWTFEDVTPGKRSFKLDSVKAGAVMGEYKVGETGNLNGKNLPSTEAGEAIRVHWEVEGTDKSGDIPAAKLASDVGRADIAADALAELASDEYDGKTVVFTVRGNFASAKISATLKYAAPVPIDETPDHLVQVMKAEDGGQSATFTWGNAWKLSGKGLRMDPPLDGWWVKEFNVKLAPDATDEFTLAPMDGADDYSWITCHPVSDGEAPAAGTYPNATLYVDLERDGGSDRLEIPINLVVNE